ncbi:hypothetical protein [Hugonella massiliensis]|uniref:hypothetical protein n=1 Tax=Hugonella massiliensis TaxID=1720315 RepID=UPI00073EE4EC|nr:hypothetical protein [Hugonella massiliensis]
MSGIETGRDDDPYEMESAATADESRNTAEYLFRIVDRSVQMEEDRYSSLTGTVGRLTTCVSILVAAATGAVALAYPSFSDSGMTGTFVAFCFLVFLTLAGSLVLLLVACLRFRYKSLNSPGELAKTVDGFPHEIASCKEGARQYARQLDEPFTTMRHRNDIIVKLVTAANILTMVAMGLMVIFAIYGVVLL